MHLLSYIEALHYSGASTNFESFLSLCAVQCAPFAGTVGLGEQIQVMMIILPVQSKVSSQGNMMWRYRWMETNKAWWKQTIPLSIAVGNTMFEMLSALCPAPWTVTECLRRPSNFQKARQPCASPEAIETPSSCHAMEVTCSSWYGCQN